MFDSAIPNHPAPGSLSEAGLALRLPADAYWQLVHSLRLTLPPPLGDSPEDLLRRDHAAIARVAALAPANAAEADVAALFVAASEQWKDCLRLAQQPETTPEWAAKCRAQAVAMMRQSQSALKLLLRMQEARRKCEKDSAAADRLVWTEHCAASLMAEALSDSPHPGPLPAGEGEGGATFPLPLGEGQGEVHPVSAIPEAAPPPASEPAPEAISRDARESPMYPDRGAGSAAILLSSPRSDIVSNYDPTSWHTGTETAARHLSPSRFHGAVPGRTASQAGC